MQVELPPPPPSKVLFFRLTKNALKIFSVSLLNKEKGDRQNASCSLALQESKHSPLSAALRKAVWREGTLFILSVVAAHK